MYSMQIEGELYEDIMKKEIYYLKNTRLVTIVTMDLTCPIHVLAKETAAFKPWPPVVS